MVRVALIQLDLTRRSGFLTRRTGIDRPDTTPTPATQAVDRATDIVSRATDGVEVPFDALSRATGAASRVSSVVARAFDGGVALAAEAMTGPDRHAPRPLEPVIGAVRAAVASGATFVVLPELWRTGPFELDTTLEAAEPLDGATATVLADLAAELGIWLHAGSTLVRTEPADEVHGLTNTSLLFDPAGDLVGEYRKRHLFGFDTGEAALIDAGDELVVVDTPLGPTGLATCYDLRFPEHFRALVDVGAETVLLPSGWPAERIDHWNVLVRARAIEDQLLVLACNATGVSGSVALGGGSMVVDAWGNVVQQAGPEATTLLVDVDPSATTDTRDAFPVLRDRL